MQTLKSHYKKYFINLFSQFFLINVITKIKKVFDTIFIIKVQRKLFLKIIDEHNVRN